MENDTDIRAAMEEGAAGRLDEAFELVDGQGAPSEASVRVTRGRAAGRLVCRVVEAGAEPEGEGHLLRPRASAPRPPAAAALLSSRIVAAALEGDTLSAPALAELPWPTIEPGFEAQLAVLWRRFTSEGADRPALIGAFDRIAAELYQLSIDDLMRFERRRGVQLSLRL